MCGDPCPIIFSQPPIIRFSYKRNRPLFTFTYFLHLFEVILAQNPLCSCLLLRPSKNRGFRSVRPYVFTPFATAAPISHPANPALSSKLCCCVSLYLKTHRASHNPLSACLSAQTICQLSEIAATSFNLRQSLSESI